MVGYYNNTGRIETSLVIPPVRPVCGEIGQDRITGEEIEVLEDGNELEFVRESGKVGRNPE